MSPHPKLNDAYKIRKDTHRELVFVPSFDGEGGLTLTVTSPAGAKDIPTCGRGTSSVWTESRSYVKNHPVEWGSQSYLESFAEAIAKKVNELGVTTLSVRSGITQASADTSPSRNSVASQPQQSPTSAKSNPRDLTSSSFQRDSSEPLHRASLEASLSPSHQHPLGSILRVSTQAPSSRQAEMPESPRRVGNSSQRVKEPVRRVSFPPSLKNSPGSSNMPLLEPSRLSTPPQTSQMSARSNSQDSLGRRSSQRQFSGHNVPIRSSPSPSGSISSLGHGIGPSTQWLSSPTSGKSKSPENFGDSSQGKYFGIKTSPGRTPSLSPVRLGHPLGLSTRPQLSPTSANSESPEYFGGSFQGGSFVQRRPNTEIVLKPWLRPDKYGMEVDWTDDGNGKDLLRQNLKLLIMQTAALIPLLPNRTRSTSTIDDRSELDTTDAKEWFRAVASLSGIRTVKIDVRNPRIYQNDQCTAEILTQSLSIIEKPVDPDWAEVWSNTVQYTRLDTREFEADLEDILTSQVKLDSVLQMPNLEMSGDLITRLQTLDPTAPAPGGAPYLVWAMKEE